MSPSVGRPAVAIVLRPAGYEVAVHDVSGPRVLLRRCDPTGRPFSAVDLLVAALAETESALGHPVGLVVVAAAVQGLPAEVAALVKAACERGVTVLRVVGLAAMAALFTARSDPGDRVLLVCHFGGAPMIEVAVAEVADGVCEVAAVRAGEAPLAPLVTAAWAAARRARRPPRRL